MDGDVMKLETRSRPTHATGTSYQTPPSLSAPLFPSDLLAWPYEYVEAHPSSGVPPVFLYTFTYSWVSQTSRTGQ